MDNYPARGGGLPVGGEARIIIESWRCLYNTLRPHGSFGYKPPTPEVFIPATARAAAQPQTASPRAPASAEAVNALALTPDHPIGADHLGSGE